MQTPHRRLGTYSHLPPDYHITAEKYKRLESEHRKLLEYVRPPAIEEVKRLALMGDFSENAAYQIAKGRLRGINRRLLEIENMLKRSIIICETASTGRIRIGSKVRVLISGREREYSILGSSETDPLRGIISHNSPIGQSLIGKSAGDTFSYQTQEKRIEGQIVSIG